MLPEGFDFVLWGPGIPAMEKLNKTHPKPVEDAKYLTLLSSWKMLHLVTSEVGAHTMAASLSIQPPETFDEEKLYGC
jgi:hypothetical protein